MQTLARILFPQHNACHLCGRWTDGGILCRRCFEQMDEERLKFVTTEFPQGIWSAVARWHHQGVPRELVHQLKYRFDPSAALPLAHGMVSALIADGRVLHSAKWLVPVPLHADRQQERGYNQAALLAKEISSETGIPVRDDLLFRTRPTGRLEQLSREERLTTMRGAFAVSDPLLVKGQSFLLVDDVFTTGATVQACAEALDRAGAGEMYAVTACRA